MRSPIRRPISNGSSPRARGTLGELLLQLAIGRFIPAGAGNTSPGRTARAPSPVHPRGRGEHAMAIPALWPVCGSSPRARGTLGYLARPARTPRFIPAGAGNTSSIKFAPAEIAVHPRGRGEHRLSISVSLALAVHPRGRGEHPDGFGVAVFKIGSSPRARGTPTLGDQGRDCWRFIPAGAGNTFLHFPVWPMWPVHPRGRGEHERWRLHASARRGSSPRARGTLLISYDAVWGHRFIPAGAGNTPTAHATGS